MGAQSCCLYGLKGQSMKVTEGGYDLSNQSNDCRVRHRAEGTKWRFFVY